MKAIVKDTGEVVDVRPCREPLSVRLAFYETEQGRKFPMFALEFEKPIDWEQRRYEIARDMLASIESNADPRMYQGNPDEQSKWAVIFADALIAELKKGAGE